MTIWNSEFDPTFSTHSYGFRPGRSAHQAVAAAQAHLASGHRWVVDLDLEKFFDRVNHDLLMGRLAVRGESPAAFDRRCIPQGLRWASGSVGSNTAGILPRRALHWPGAALSTTALGATRDFHHGRLAQRVRDTRVLKLVRAFLNAGVLEEGLVSVTEEGTPQGGPRSPLLSNIVLHALDCELERRGHRFVRYADDCNVYVHSARAGHRVMTSLTRFITTRLKLKVNTAKSAVAPARVRSFLGFSFTGGPRPKRRLAASTVVRFRKRVRMLTRRVRGVSLRQMARELATYLLGWRAYFGFCQTPTILRRLDKWIRRRLRAVVWKQWYRSSTRFRELRKRGVNAKDAILTARSNRGPWRAPQRSAGRFPALTSTRSDCRISSGHDRSPGRTAVVRTRMPGGVGGAAPRGAPLSRSGSTGRRPRHDRRGCPRSDDLGLGQPLLPPLRNRWSVCGGSCLDLRGRRRGRFRAPHRGSL